MGTSSCSNSSRFGATSTFNWVMPVTLPPGRLRLATRSSGTGSLPISKTIGMVVVAAFAAMAAASGGRERSRSPDEQPDRPPMPAAGQLMPGQAIFDGDVLTLDKARFFQTFTESRPAAPGRRASPWR